MFLGARCHPLYGMGEVLDYAVGRGIDLGTVCGSVQFADGLHGHDLFWTSGVPGYWWLHGWTAAQKGQWLTFRDGTTRRASRRGPGSPDHWLFLYPPDAHLFCHAHLGVLDDCLLHCLQMVRFHWRR